MASSNADDDELLAEYDEAVFENGIRGKYAAQFKAGTNLIRLAPDIAAAFPDEQSVNAALRLMQTIMLETERLKQHAT